MARKQLTVSVCAAAALCLGLAGTADAEEMAGRLGVGGQTSLTGATGLAGTYYFSQVFGIQTTFAFNLIDPDGGDSITELQLGASVLYTLASLGDVQLSGVGSFGLAFADRGDSGVDVAFGGGIRAAYFVTTFLSLHGEVGLIFDIVPDTGQSLDNDVGIDPTGMTPIPKGTLFGINTDLLGSAGFTFWW